MSGEPLPPTDISTLLKEVRGVGLAPPEVEPFLCHAVESSLYQDRTGAEADMSIEVLWCCNLNTTKLRYPEDLSGFALFFQRPERRVVKL